MGDRRRGHGVAARSSVVRPLPARMPDAGLVGWREIRTFLDPGTQVNGKLSFTAPTRVEGRLRGEVRASDLLVVAPGSVLQGTIWVRYLVVAGEIRGQILDAERVEVQPGGRVFGLIETKALIVAEGAVFEGDCRMGLEQSAGEERPARG